MSSSSDARVLRGAAATAVRPARMDAELTASPFAVDDAVDARLVDPHLEQVVAGLAARAAAQARREGHAQGLREGRAAAAAEAAERAAQDARRREAEQAARDAEHARAVALLLAAAEELRAHEAVAVAEVEDAVVDLALHVARAVLDHELTASTDPGREAVARALALAPDGGHVVLRLHPDDAACLRGLDDLAGGRVLVVSADSSVERGGCVAETAGRRIDAQLGTALARVQEVLR